MGAVLDMDCAKTLHTGNETFIGEGSGSCAMTWDDLTKQDIDGNWSATSKANWDNTAFEQQNSIEYELGQFNQTLDNPGASNIDGGNDTNSVNNDLLGTDFQDSPTPLV